MKPIKFRADYDDSPHGFACDDNTGERIRMSVVVAQANAVPDLVAMLRECIEPLEYANRGGMAQNIRLMLARFEETTP